MVIGLKRYCGRRRLHRVNDEFDHNDDDDDDDDDDDAYLKGQKSKRPKILRSCVDFCVFKTR